MTPPAVDTADLEQRARALLDERMSTVRALAELRHNTADKRAAFEQAEQEDVAGYAAALRVGWTNDDLRKLGFEAPGKRPVGRPRKPRKAQPPTTPEQSLPANDGSQIA